MKLVKILSVVIVALVVGNVTMTNRNVDESVVVASLNKQISNLQDQNTILLAQVADLGSISHLTDKLAASDFIASPKTAALHVTPVVVALR